MSSSRRSTNPRDREPFPSYPAASHAGPSDQEETTTHSSTVTTTTVVDGNNDPVTYTQTQFPIQQGSSTTPAVITTGPGEEAPVPFSQTTVQVPSPIRRRPIGIRRLPSASRLSSGETDDGTPSRSGSGRRRSASDPQGNNRLSAGGGSTRLTRPTTRDTPLETLREEQPGKNQTLQVPGQGNVQTTSGVGRRRRSVSNAAHSITSRFSNDDHENPPNEYENDVVDYLDVIGMEVAHLPWNI